MKNLQNHFWTPKLDGSSNELPETVHKSFWQCHGVFRQVKVLKKYITLREFLILYLSE